MIGRPAARVNGGPCPSPVALGCHAYRRCGAGAAGDRAGAVPPAGSGDGAAAAPLRSAPPRPGGDQAARADGSRTIAHGGDPCAVGRPANPSRARPNRRIYQWTDASGKVVFSDRAPAGAVAAIIDTDGDTGVGRFSADYDYAGFTAPLAFQQQLEIDIDGVFHFLADDLGLRDVQPVHLRLRIVDEPARFAAALSRTGLAGGDYSGFYRFSDNQAVVRWQGEAVTRAVARHEIAHLALGNWLGRTPLWLNEGLAELVERMRFQHSFATTEATPGQVRTLQRLLRAGRLPSLRDFLAGERDDWNRWGNDVAYPYAWSLAHFLVQEPSRQRLVSGLLNALAGHRCLAFDDIAWLERHYPGGLNALEAEWRRWLLGGQVARVQF
jgi:hypothetical protein